jgi:hypothetical protein
MLQTFAIYMLKSTVCSALLFGYYWIALRNKRFHYYNRFYLLVSVILSITLPLLNLQLFTFESDSNTTIRFFRFIYPGENHIISTKKSQFPDWQQLAMILLGSITSGMLLLLAIKIIRLYKFKRIYPVNTTEEFDFINTDLPQAPFSFLKNIFWRNDISLKETTGQQILHHEITHIKQRHTLDKLFMQITFSVFWINPFFWLIQRELYLIHEFIADEKAVADKDASAFASMLLHAQYGKLIFSPAQSFFYSPVKRRLLMLTTSKEPRFSYARRITALLSLAFVVLFFSFKIQETDKQGNNKVTSNTYSAQSKVAVFDTTHPKELGYYKGKAIYKVSANAEKGIAVLTFGDKTEKEISIEEAKKSGVLLPQPPPPLATRAAEISATTNNDTVPKKVDVSARKITLSASDSVLYVINGKVATAKEVSVIKPEEISSVNVLKDKSATDKYGSHGKNGVVEIITKNTVEEIITKKNAPENIKTKEVVVYTHAQRMPSFPGGPEAWQKFLEKNLNTTLPVDKGAPPGKYTVVVSFQVDVEGNVSDVKALNDPGYGTGAEAARVIARGPKWIPAEESGRRVAAETKQAITF